MVNYYHVLGLNENASQAEIKAAFKKLAVKYHPDKHPDRPEMEEKFKEVNQAHQILSDPYEKARYDLKLKYQQFSGSHETTSPYSRPSSTFHQRPNPKYYRAKVDHRKNMVATAYAFGITFIIAALVMGGIWAKGSYDEHQLEQEKLVRRATFEKAKEQFESGEYMSAFHIMADFKHFWLEEEDMKKFKRSMIDEIIIIGDQKFDIQDYPAAIELYELVQEFQPSNPFYSVKKKLADAYSNTGESEKAIEILNEFLVNEYELISSIVKIAEIHRDKFDDPEEALDHYIIGHKLAIKRYKRIFGEAYPLVIKQEYIPDSHYDLYSGLADIYLRLDDTEMAIKAADWNKYVWPDSTDAFITTAYANIKLNNSDIACEEFNEAKLRGWRGETPISCN